MADVALLAQLDLQPVTKAAGILIYAGLGLLAVWGLFCVFLMQRQIARRRFRTEEAASDFLDQVRDCLDDGDFEEAEKLCSTPSHWYRAVPLLARVALAERRRPMPKIRQSVTARFEREVLGEIDARSAWINTVIKAAPMLGLLGTVTGMIGAFAELAGSTQIDQSDLADDISVALFTTALGLLIAVPLVLMSNSLQVRVRKLEDATADQIQIFLDDLEPALDRAKSRQQVAGSGGGGI